MENLRNLNQSELIEIAGGNTLIVRWAKVIYEALQIQDAINDFIDGWNSVECGCEEKK
jgi:hypothetical protein